jgi:hypothetical protein
MLRLFFALAVALLTPGVVSSAHAQHQTDTAAGQHSGAAVATPDGGAPPSEQGRAAHAPEAHDMWMRPIGRDWQLIGMAQGYPVLTFGAPAQSALPINRTDTYFTQPAVMANLEHHTSRIVLRTTVNLEGLTQRDGEVTFGAWGEGYLDSRHPHTVLHEAMVSLNVWETVAGAFSLSAGRGFAPFGTDDPMARPVQKYPTNHHLSQILERWTINGVYLAERWSAEGAVFGGTEPTGPWDIGNVDGFGRSWSVRLARWFGEGRAPVAPWEVSGSYARVLEVHDQEEALTVLYNTAVRHERVIGASRMYGLAEFSVGDSERNGRNFALLVESQLDRRPHQPYVRMEYATRPEYQRDGPPGTEAFFRYDHDDFASGATRWLITSIGYGHEVARYPTSVRPFVELQHHRVRPERGTIRPEELFGGSQFWSVSLGLRLFLGGEPMRMGRYGVLDPVTIMHRQRMEPAHHPGHHGH